MFGHQPSRRDERAAQVRPRSAWRRALHRFRHLIAAVALLSGFLVAVRALAPGIEVYAVSRDLPAGTALTSSDLTTVSVPEAALPAGHFTAPPLDEQLLVDLPARTVLSPHLLVTDDLSAGAPPDTFLIPVAISDPASLALTQQGTYVTLLATSDMTSETVVIDSAYVLAVFPPESSSLLGVTESQASSAIVALPREAAHIIMGTSDLPVRVALPSRS